MRRNEVTQCKITVIIPIYNMAKYLDESIPSWLHQTLYDIEIICIDDASTDASLEIIHQYALQDSRIQVYHFETNKSAWCARKLGIEKASGEYILFADADDTVLPEACEELYAEMTSDPVDILQFGTEIINVNGLPESRIQNMQKFLAPYPHKLNGHSVFLGCFDNHKYRFSLWNKLFSSTLCKRAFHNLGDYFLPKAQDMLAYFIISFFAQSYRSISKKYYRYYFGRGSTGYNILTLKQFERYCTEALVADAIHDFLESQGCEKHYSMIESEIRKNLLNDCITRWFNEVPMEERGAAFDLLLKYWKPSEVISILAQKYWFKRDRIGVCVHGAASLQYNHRKVKTIASYYHSCANGGAQRVVCQLAALWDSMGYNVIILTDEKPSETDYPIPQTVKRLIIPHYKEINSCNYFDRCQSLQRILKENNVDVIVYHAWVLNLMLWDELACKSVGVAFIPYCHSIFTLPVLNAWDSVTNYIAPYRLADAVVALSSCDQVYWQHFNPNVHLTINPFPSDMSEWIPAFHRDSHDILWIGRLSVEKRPSDAITILKKVLEKIPDAHLHIVGSSNNGTFEQRLINQCAQIGISEHVSLYGFQAQVRPFYEKAAVFLMTSDYEGYSLTLLESKLAGIPCVMYDLPYLTLSEGNRGIIAVECHNPDAAANAIIELLSNPEKCKAYGNDARAHIEELFGFNFREKWSFIFESITREHETQLSPTQKLMLTTLLEHHTIGLQKIKRSASPNHIGKHGKIVKYAFLVEKGLHCLHTEGAVVAGKKTFKKIYKHFAKRGAASL